MQGNCFFWQGMRSWKGLILTPYDEAYNSYETLLPTVAPHPKLLDSLDRNVWLWAWNCEWSYCVPGWTCCLKWYRHTVNCCPFFFSFFLFSGPKKPPEMYLCLLKQLIACCLWGTQMLADDVLSFPSFPGCCAKASHEEFHLKTTTVSRSFPGLFTLL